MIEVVPFELRHIVEIDRRPIDIAQMNQWGEDWIFERLRIAEISPGVAYYTCFVDGKPFFCGGVTLMWPGVGEFWGIGSTEIERKPKTFHKVTRKILEQLAAHYELHRAQAHCWVGFERSKEWLCRLGFEVEGIKRGWAPTGEDYYIMSRAF